MYSSYYVTCQLVGCVCCCLSCNIRTAVSVTGDAKDRQSIESLDVVDKITIDVEHVGTNLRHLHVWSICCILDIV